MSMAAKLHFDAPAPVLDLRADEPVEVHIVWSATRQGTLKKWINGYTFARYEPNPITGVTDAIVRYASGPWTGDERRYPPHEVRRTQTNE